MTPGPNNAHIIDSSTTVDLLIVVSLMIMDVHLPKNDAALLHVTPRESVRQ
jgi:hypothetical protein